MKCGVIRFSMNWPFIPSRDDENLIIDVIYDNLSPLRLQDLYRGTDIPQGVQFWPDWFDIPAVHGNA